MNNKNSLSVSQARKNLYALIDDVGNSTNRYTITHRGKAQAVLFNPEELDAWEETMDILSNDKLVKQIRKAEKEIEQGKTIPAEEVYEELEIDPKSLSQDDN